MEDLKGDDQQQLAKAKFKGFLGETYATWLSRDLERDDVRNRLERKPVIMPDTLSAADDLLETIKAEEDGAFGQLVAAMVEELVRGEDRPGSLRTLKEVTEGDYGKFLAGVEAKLVADLRAFGVDVEGLIAQQPETVREITGVKVLDALLGRLHGVQAAEKLKKSEALVPKLAERAAEARHS